MSQHINHSTHKTICKGRFTYQTCELLGKGSTGNVYKGYDHKQNKSVAIKVIYTAEMNQVQQNLIENQKTALKIIKHSNVMKVNHIEIQHSWTYIISQLYEGGSLKQLLQKKGCLSQQKALQFFQKLIHGYCAIVQVNVIHRDLKPANILLTKNQQPIIIDFGYSQIIVANKNITVFNVGSPTYMAPQAYKKTIYSEKSDIWSLGVIFYQILTGKTLDYGVNINQYFEMLNTSKESLITNSFSSVTSEILSGCLEILPQNRITSHRIKYLLDKQIYGKKLNARPFSTIQYRKNEIKHNFPSGNKISEQKQTFFHLKSQLRPKSRQIDKTVFQQNSTLNNSQTKTQLKQIFNYQQWMNSQSRKNLFKIQQIKGLTSFNQLRINSGKQLIPTRSTKFLSLIQKKSSEQIKIQKIIQRIKLRQFQQHEQKNNFVKPYILQNSNHNENNLRQKGITMVKDQISIHKFNNQQRKSIQKIPLVNVRSQYNIHETNSYDNTASNINIKSQLRVLNATNNNISNLAFKGNISKPNSFSQSKIKNQNSQTRLNVQDNLVHSNNLEDRILRKQGQFNHNQANHNYSKDLNYLFQNNPPPFKDYNKANTFMPSPSRSQKYTSVKQQKFLSNNPNNLNLNFNNVQNSEKTSNNFYYEATNQDSQKYHSTGNCSNNTYFIGIKQDHNLQTITNHNFNQFDKFETNHYTKNYYPATQKRQQNQQKWTRMTIDSNPRYNNQTLIELNRLKVQAYNHNKAKSSNDILSFNSNKKQVPLTKINSPNHNKFKLPNSKQSYHDRFDYNSNVQETTSKKVISLRKLV